MHLHHLSVTRTARVAMSGGDGMSSHNAPGEIWTVLHGYRQTAPRFLRRFASIAGPERRIVAPEGLSRFYLETKDRANGSGDAVGASWMTREDRELEIEDYVRYLDEVARGLGRVPPPPPSQGPAASASKPPASPTHTVLGFSQGAHTAARWAVLGSTPMHRLVLWGAGFPGDLPESSPSRLAGVEIVLVRGEADTLRNHREEEREEGWLAEAGLSARILSHPGGHRVEERPLQELAGGVR
ncbi:MAG: hypothetical protein WEA09_06265 [Gemmatimonadota bacterium]